MWIDQIRKTSKDGDGFTSGKHPDVADAESDAVTQSMSDVNLNCFFKSWLAGIS